MLTGRFRLSGALFGFIFAFWATNLNATTISVGGFTDVLIGVLPGATITSFGDAVFDSGGNIYIASRTSTGSEIVKITPGGTFSVFITDTSNSMTGLAIDGNDLYASFNSGVIKKTDITAVSPTFSTFATVSGASSLNDIAIAPSGSPFAGDLVFGTSSGALGRFNTTTAGLTSILTGTSVVSALDFDASGDLFYVGGASLRRFSGGVETTIASVGTDSSALAIDLSTGDQYVGDGSLNTLIKVSGGVATAFATGIDFDSGFFQDPLTFSPDGSFLFYAEGERNSTAFKITGFSTNVAPVPEPGTLTLLGAGMLGLGWVRRRRKAA